MLEKITFEKKLGIDSREKKYIGLKIGTISVLVGAAGGLVSILGLQNIGFWIVVIGVLGCGVGFVLHLVAMVSSSKD
jgi:hypothetical protein